MTHSTYYHSDAIDFALDEYFQEWIYSPNTKNRFYWEDFLENNPQKKEEVAEAKKLLELMDFKKESDNKMPDFDTLLKRIKNTMKHMK